MLVNRTVRLIGQFYAGPTTARLSGLACISKWTVQNSLTDHDSQLDRPQSEIAWFPEPVPIFEPVQRGSVQNKFRTGYKSLIGTIPLYNGSKSRAGSEFGT